MPRFRRPIKLTRRLASTRLRRYPGVRDVPLHAARERFCMAGRLRIGIDLDNTLIDYDAVFCTVAREQGVIDDATANSKAAVRAALRALPEGEFTWQRLQGFVYGKGIEGAALFDGAEVFLRRAREHACEVFIVSHKTEFGHYDPDRINLRDAARGWLTTRGFFHADGFAIREENVLFVSTRAEKISMIRELGVSFFIDDLPEVLEDSNFPAGVTGIHFTSGSASDYPRAFGHWRDITTAVFG